MNQCSTVGGAPTELRPLERRPGSRRRALADFAGRASVEQRAASRYAAAAIFVLTLLLSGCTGIISSPQPGSSSSAPGGSAAGGGTGTGASAPSTQVVMGTADSPLNRLTRVEYNNTVLDLVADSTAPANALGPEPNGQNGFESPITVGPTQAGELQGLAEGVAQRAVGNLNALLPCDPTALGEDACAEQFIAAFGRRAFRRPLEMDEQTALLGVYSAARDTLALPFEGRVRVLISAILQSPQFLYHWETGSAPLHEDGNLVRLPPFQLASRLSYFLWRSMPDNALLDAAESGALDTPAGLAQQAQRLLAAPRAKAAIDDFIFQLLKLSKLPDQSKDAQLFPNFTPDIRAAAITEIQAFASHVFLDTRGTLSDLLTSTTGIMTSKLMPLYGVTALDDHGGVETVQLDSSQRSGLLTRIAFLAANAGPSESSPVARGRRVREKILCQPIGAPPGNVDTTLHEVSGKTQRQRLEVHETNSGCSGCHLVMDPPGYAFEMYDAVGSYRTQDNQGFSVDSSGKLINMEAGPIDFANAVDLSRALAQTAEARSCVIRQLLRFGTGHLETQDDLVAVNQIVDSASKAGFVLQDVLLAAIQSPAFTHRAPTVGEVFQ